jgi:Fur family ferric uptake transcriptional regulator
MRELNKNRKKIINYIKDYKEPVNAQVIASFFKNQMDQATVYRNLNYLENNHYIEGFIYNCKDAGIVKFYYQKNDKHLHFFHCKECHHFQAIEECNNKVRELEKQNNIKIDNHIIYYTGTCNKCL